MEAKDAAAETAESLDEEDPIEKLKESWVLSGEKRRDFSVARYKRKLRAQEKADFKFEYVKGTTDYEAKMSALRRIERRHRFIKQVLLAPLAIPREAAKDARWLGNVAYDALEPRFRKRARLRKRNLRRIEIHESEALRLVSELETVRAEREEAQREEYRVDHERGRLIEEQRASDDFREKAEREERERRREEALAEYRLRRQRDAQEARDRQRTKVEDDERCRAEDLKRRREWRVVHYGRLQGEARDEARRRRAQADAKDDAADAERAARTALEVRDRDVAMAFDQTKGPATTGSLGIFGGDGIVVPLEDGGTGRPGPQTDGTSAADHPRVKLFSSKPDPTNENKWHALDMLESELTRARHESAAFKREEDDGARAASALDALRQRLAIERAQLEAEHKVLLARIAGPPRREATVVEKESTHRRRLRISELVGREADLDHKAELQRRKRDEAAGARSRMEARVAALDERCAKRRGVLEKSCGEPPSIVGRPLPSKTVAEAKPTEARLAIVAATNLALAHDEARAVLQTRKNDLALERTVWAKGQQRFEDAAHLDDMITRLAELSRRIKHSRSHATREDLQQAIQLWWARGEQLRVVEIKREGSVDWWACRSPELCRNVEQWRSSDLLTVENSEGPRDPMFQGAAHGEATSGALAGTVELPGLDTYAIELVVTKRDPNMTDLGDATDRCTVLLGPNLRNLTVAAVVKNVVDDFAGCARYEISHTMRTETLAFRIEFMSSTAESTTHFAIEQGAYAPKRVPPLEVSDGTNRVVSSFVKQLRVERMHQGNWLQELIRVEEANDDNATWWDSDALHGVKQRFPVEAFCGLMRDKLKTTNEASEKRDDDIRPSRKQRRVEASAARYTERKRAEWKDDIDKAQRLVGSRLEIFDEGNEAWLHTVVRDVEIQWYENGTRCAIRHQVEPVDDLGRATGPPYWLDIARVRSYASQKAVVERDPAIHAIWDRNEASAAAADAAKLLMRLDIETKREERDAQVQAEERHFETVRREAIEHARSAAIVEAKSLLDDTAVLFVLKKLARHVLEELRAGLIKPADIGVGVADMNELQEVHTTLAGASLDAAMSADNEPRWWQRRKKEYSADRDLAPSYSLLPARRKRRATLKKAAIEEAKRRWQSDFVTTSVKAEERNWAAAAKQRHADLEALRNADQVAADKAERDATLRDEARSRELAAQRAERRARMREKLGRIPNFSAAVPKAANCEHIRSKSWGDRYGKGVRCLDCGKELTLTHLDEAQQSGIGSGDDADLCKRVKRHRFNRPAYRAESADMAAEVAAIEIERWRLEKERWAIREIEPHFYDLDDMKPNYNLDRRHAVDDDRSAAFALTPRRDDAKRLATFRDLLLAVGRIQSFQLRLGELAEQRSTLDVERSELEGVLGGLHREIVADEMSLQQVEQDMLHAATVLKCRVVAEQRASNARALLREAKLETKRKDMDLVGAAEAAETAEAEARTLGSAVRDLLRQRSRADKTLRAVVERAEACRRDADAALVRSTLARDSVDSMHYRRRGVLVPTPYGHSRVVMYRPADDVVVVRLSFGSAHKLARAYIPIQNVMQMERAIAASTRVAMRAEETQARQFYAAEMAARDKERHAMHDDETRYKDILAFEAAMAEEQALVSVNVAKAVESARLALKSAEGRAEIWRRAAKDVSAAARKREIAQRTWRGKGARPRKMGRVERARTKFRIFRQRRKDFVVEAARAAEREARQISDHKQAVKASEATLEVVYDGFLTDFLVTLADETLRSGLAAKSRTEDDTGVVFGTPAHMQYPVYTLLAKWWLDKKRQLKEQLEVWGAYSAKDELRREQNRKDAQAMVRDVELKEARERERQRQNEMIKRLAREEADTRRFYRDELRQCLDERRAMQAAHDETRAYLREVAALEALARSKYNVMDCAPAEQRATTKAQRRVQLKHQRLAKEQRQRENLAMADEDLASHELRQRDVQLRQLDALRGEMALTGEGNDTEDSVSESAQVSSSDDDESLPPKAPPDASPDQVAAAKKARSLARRQRRVEQANAKAAAEREAAEKAANDELEAAVLEARIAHAKAELEWMELEEEARLVEKQRRVARENLRKLALYCQRKGQEELKARAIATKLRSSCARRATSHDQAVAWLAECEAREAQCRRVQARTHRDTKFMDTKALAGGVYQRFETTELYAHLHTAYFQRLVYVVANRAEIVATERRQLHVHEMLRKNSMAAAQRQAALTAVWRKRQRDDYLRLRRSELGKKIFGNSQRAVLVAVFRGWKRYWTWHLGHRQAFELNYTLLKHKLDLQRAHGDVLQSSSTQDEDEPQTDEATTPTLTRLEQVQCREIECTTCGLRFTEAHNRAEACTYHPGEYKLSCPRSCPAFSDARRMTTQCMGHRAKRWSCCDARSRGTLGCQTRFHTAPSTEPLYGDVARRLTDEYTVEKVALDERLAKIKAENTVHVVSLEHRAKLDDMAGKLSKERSIVAKFKELKCDKYVDNDALVEVIKEQHQQHQDEFANRQRTLQDAAKHEWLQIQASRPPSLLA